MTKIEEYKIKKNLQETLEKYLNPEELGKYIKFRFTDEPSVCLWWDKNEIPAPYNTSRAYIAKHFCNAVQNHKDELFKEAIAEAKQDLMDNLYDCKAEAQEILDFIKKQSEELYGK